MTQQGTLNFQGDITARKHRGNRNSREAGRSTNPERDCNRILALLAERAQRIPDEDEAGLTCEEISIALKMPYQTASARCADLKYRLKSVVESLRRRQTKTGRWAAVLKPVGTDR